MAHIHLDNNEEGYLKAYLAEDADAEHWICPWAITDKAAEHGADAIGTSYHGSMSVARRLTTRKLLVAEPNTRGAERGYAITKRGKDAVVEVTA